MVGLPEITGLERLLIGSLVNSKPIYAAEALQLVESGARFLDPCCQRAAQLMSESVSKLSPGQIRLDLNWWISVVTSNGRKNGDLRDFLVSTSNEVEQTMYAGDPLRVAREYIDDWRRHQMAAVLMVKARETNECQDIVEHLDKTLDELAEIRLACSPGHGKDETLLEVLQEIENVRHGKVSLGVPLGIQGSARLANAIRLRPGRIYSLGALKKTGKSKFLLYCLTRAAEQGVPSTYFSLEMSREQVLRWFLGLRARVDTKKIPSPELTQNEFVRLVEAGEEWRKMPLDVVFQPGATVGHVRHVARKMRFAYPKADNLLLGIDFLQAMNMEQRSAESRSDAIERGMFKMLQAAQDYQIGIVLLCQLPNRAEGQNLRTMADLKGSGAIAEVSEAIMILDNLVRLRKAEANGTVPFRLYIDQRDGESGLRFKLNGNLQHGIFEECLDEIEPEDVPY